MLILRPSNSGLKKFINIQKCPFSTKLDHCALVATESDMLEIPTTYYTFSISYFLYMHIISWKTFTQTSLLKVKKFQMWVIRILLCPKINCPLLNLMAQTTKWNCDIIRNCTAAYLLMQMGDICYGFRLNNKRVHLSEVICSKYHKQ